MECSYNSALYSSNSYVLSFSLGAGPVPALLLPEIFASRIRAKAVALSLGMHWVRVEKFGFDALSATYYMNDALPSR